MRKRKDPGISFEGVPRGVVVEIYDKAYSDFDRMSKQAKRHNRARRFVDGMLDLAPMCVSLVLTLFSIMVAGSLFVAFVKFVLFH